MNLRAVILILVLLAVAPNTGRGQTLVNPDISAIADMRYLYRDNVAAELADANNVSFEFQELELAFAGYLNPYMRADVFLGIHGVAGPFELEEGYATILRGVPFQLKFGKYLLDFGKINTQHPHEWGWLDRPLMHQTVFGMDGASVIGLGAQRLQPLGDSAITLSVNAFRSDFFKIPVHEHNEEAESEHEHAHGGEGKTEIGGSGRLSFFRSLTENTHVDFGVEGMYAIYDSEHDLKTWLTGIDFKYRWRPDTYRSLNIIAEALYCDRVVKRHDTEVTDTVTSYGTFLDLDFQFRKTWDIGVYYDWTQNAYEQDAETTGYGGYIGYMPVEETARFSIVYRQETSDFYKGTAHTATFQVLWSLGPHKPHPF